MKMVLKRLLLIVHNTCRLCRCRPMLCVMYLADIGLQEIAEAWTTFSVADA